jgi:sulfonate transport system permease protein
MVDISTSLDATARPSNRPFWKSPRLLRGLAIPAVLLFVWTIASYSGAIQSPLLVSPERILALPFVDEAGRNLWLGLGVSIVRLVVGFAIGAGAGIAFGLLTGMSRTADRAVGPSFNSLRQIALFAWIPLLTAWFGNGDAAKIIYVALSAFFPAALNTHEGLRNIPAHYLELARVLRFSWPQRIRLLLLPGAMPSIFIGIQIALITAWIGTVGAEYAIGVGRGIGTFISGGREQFRMDIVLLGVIALALVGYAINVLCGRIFRHLLHWQGNQQ